MTRMLPQNKTRPRFATTDVILYKSSYSKNNNYRILLQLYYITKAENKKEARLPKNDFRKLVVQPKKEVISFKRSSNHFNFNFANVFVQKIMYRYFL